MQINWFPGHMNKARNEVKAIIPRVDLLIEVLDARIPYSSENPMIRELRGKTPVLKLLAKSDLADPEMTERWKAWHEKQSGVRAIAITTDSRNQIRSLKGKFYQMLPEEKANKQSMTAMIAGVPNVGKSTIVNIFAGRKVAKTGNEPAVTRGQQKIVIGDGVTLLDTPGMLWPKVENPKSGLRLAAVGSIKDTAMEYEDAAGFIVDYMLEHYPQRLTDCFGVEDIPADCVTFLEEIGRKRNCIGRSNVVDYERISRVVITEFRNGRLGKVTLESPEAIEREVTELEVELAAKANAKKAKKNKRKQNFKAKAKAKRESRRRE